MEKQLDGIGKPVSGGAGYGPAYCAAIERACVVDLPVHHDQKAQLDQAILVAREGLVELAKRHEEVSAEILEFQIEMLEDPSLLTTLDEYLAAGHSAASAWNGVYSELYLTFSHSEDPDLQARAVDVLDLKNRGLRAFTGFVQKDFPPGSIFVGDDIEPSAFLAHDWSKGGGILLQEGSDASHVAILARARAVPMVVKTGSLPVSTGDYLQIDGRSGSYRSTQDCLAIPPGRKDPFFTPSPELGHRLRSAEFKLFANISDPEEINANMVSGLDGIGLVRTEFLIRNDVDLYDHAQQEHIYARIIALAGGKPVTFRLFDFGFDKPLPGKPARKDSSPLGLRGVRLLLQNPDILANQIRALLLASRSGPCNILVPMVSIPSEMQEIRSIVMSIWQSLSEVHPQIVKPQIGMMVEVPSAAMMLDEFMDADFFSFGNNDLAQYLLAVDRHDSAVADLYSQFRMPVLRLLKHALHLARPMEKPMTVCGDMAADATVLPELIQLGFSEFSVALDRVAMVDALLGTFHQASSPGIER